MNFKFLKKRKTLIISGIIILAVFLRFYKLGQVPPALNWDETAQGYNAYSLLKTGKDEHQKAFPHRYLISFGDYKPPLYTYLTVPSISVFGVNAFAVRFISALAGVLTVYATFFLTEEILHKKDKAAKIVPFLAAFLLAASPWHIQLSRAAYEANLATLLTTTGVLFLLKGLKKKKFLFVSAFLFALSFYTFNTPRVFVPLLGLAFISVFHRSIWKHKKGFIPAAVLFLLIVAPLVPHLLSEEGRLRFREVNIFADIRPLQQAHERRAVDNNQWWSRILHNRRFVYGRLFLKHYFDHFKTDYLFFKGDRNPRFSSQDVGQMYLISLPFLILGALHFFKERDKRITFLFLWLLTAIIPAATARETPHALRTEVILPTFQIITAYGIYQLWQKLKNNKQIIQTATIGLYLSFVFYFMHNYIIHFPKKYASEWQYGYKQAVEYVAQIEDDYEQVVVSNDLGRAYIYFLFYQQYPPQQYWETKNEDIKPFGVREVDGFGRYTFEPKSVEGDDKKRLWVMTPGDVHKEYELIKEIKQPNGKVVFVIYET
jgi:4-amino-4-deoxy-L-arabinose transferase-like glycosyltransferase